MHHRTLSAIALLAGPAAAHLIPREVTVTVTDVVYPHAEPATKTVHHTSTYTIFAVKTITATASCVEAPHTSSVVGVNPINGLPVAGPSSKSSSKTSSIPVISITPIIEPTSRKPMSTFSASDGSSLGLSSVGKLPTAPPSSIAYPSSTSAPTSTSTITSATTVPSTSTTTSTVVVPSTTSSSSINLDGAATMPDYLSDRVTETSKPSPTTSEPASSLTTDDPPYTTPTSQSSAEEPAPKSTESADEDEGSPFPYPSEVSSEAPEPKETESEEASSDDCPYPYPGGC